MEKHLSKSFKKLESCKKIKCGSLKKIEHNAKNNFEKELKKLCSKKLSFDKYNKCDEDLYNNSKSGKLYSKATKKYMNCIFPKCQKERKAYKQSYEVLASYKKEHMSGGKSGGKSGNKSNVSKNTNSQKECSTKFCKSYFLPKIKKELNKSIEKMAKHFTRKMSPSEKKDYFEKQKEKEKARLKEKAKTLKQDEKREFDKCVSTYCNKGCKNTVYEDGDSYPASLETHLRSNLEKDFKDDKKFIESMIEGNKKQRADIFKNKSTVLKDNFYKKLNKKTVKLLKSKKAISGCTNWNMVL